MEKATFELFVYIEILCHGFFRFPMNLRYCGIRSIEWW